ncbi:MAG: hypothetical protein JNM41_16365 [Flavipsychrobacter sp.]|nr:hypothetical protein [Flavipsychrobacter sp.]
MWLPVVVMLLAVHVIPFYTNEAIAQSINDIGSTITVRGNMIGMSKPRTDTIIDLSPHHPEPDQIRITGPEPIFLNGRCVYRPDEDSTIVLPEESMRQLESKLTENVEEVLRHFPDGSYIVHNPQYLVNEKGEILFYIFNGLSADSDDRPRMMVSEVQKESVSQILDETAKAMKLKPATKNEIPIPVFVKVRLSRFTFKVKNHFIFRKAYYD